MALDAFIESWQPYAGLSGAALLASLQTRWTNPAGQFTWLPTDGRRGNPCLLMGGDMMKTMSHQSRWVAGCGFKTANPSGDLLFRLANNDVNLFTLALNTDGTMTMRGANTTQIIGTTGNRLAYANKWLDWEVDVSFSGTTNILVTAALRVDGHDLLSGSISTGINMASLLSNSATANVFALIDGSGSGLGYIDGSFYIHNGGGDIPGYWGDLRILKVLPNGDTAQADWTPNSGSVHFDRVNELPSDDDTTYVSAAVAGKKDAWDWQDLPAFLGAIRCVQVSMAARKDDEGSKAFRIGVGATLAEAVSSDYYVNDSYIYYHFPWDLDPATGLPWTVAGFNAKQFGPELVL